MQFGYYDSSACLCIHGTHGFDGTRLCNLPDVYTTTTTTSSTAVSSTITVDSSSQSSSTSRTSEPEITTSVEPETSGSPVGPSRSVPFSNRTIASSSFPTASEPGVPSQSSPVTESVIPSSFAPVSVSSEPTSTVASSAIATATVDPLPASIGVFNFLGCTGSDENYPSFSLEISSDDMDLETWTTACLDHVYAGVHNT